MPPACYSSKAYQWSDELIVARLNKKLVCYYELHEWCSIYVIEKACLQSDKRINVNTIHNKESPERHSESESAREGERQKNYSSSRPWPTSKAEKAASLAERRRCKVKTWPWITALMAKRASEEDAQRETTERLRERGRKRVWVVKIAVCIAPTLSLIRFD